jgi:hypothetical protein
LREPNLGKTNSCVSLLICLRFVLRPLSDSFIFLALTRLVVVIKFVNFRFALFTSPLATFTPLGCYPPYPLSSFRPKTSRASFPPVHGGGRDNKHGCHGLARLSSHFVQLQRLAQELRGCVVFSRLSSGDRWSM